jgi:hypothetical protein
MPKDSMKDNELYELAKATFGDQRIDEAQLEKETQAARSRYSQLGPQIQAAVTARTLGDRVSHCGVADCASETLKKVAITIDYPATPLVGENWVGTEAARVDIHLRNNSGCLLRDAVLRLIISGPVTVRPIMGSTDKWHWTQLEVNASRDLRVFLQGTQKQGGQVDILTEFCAEVVPFACAPPVEWRETIGPD